MARWNRYACLNPTCGHGFDALDNPMPECPKCRSIKLEVGHYGDMGSGRADPNAATSSSQVKRIDAVLRNQAHQFGMTDINNSGGQAAKSHKPDPTAGKYGTMNIMGVEAPIGDRPSAAWGSSPYTAFKAPSSKGEKLPGNRSTRQYTNVTHEHKADI